MVAMDEDKMVAMLGTRWWPCWIQGGGHVGDKMVAMVEDKMMAMLRTRWWPWLGTRWWPC